MSMNEPGFTKIRYDSLAGEANPVRKIGYLKKNILPFIRQSPTENPRIIEIGPGKGELLEILRDLGYTNISAFDVCVPYVDSLREKGFTIHEGESTVDFLGKMINSSSDYLIAIDVLEHLPLHEILGFLGEAHRVLKRGGCLVVQVPNVSGLFGWNTFAADPTHLTPFNEYRLLNCLRAAGFTRVACRGTDFPAGLRDLLRRFLRKPIFLGCRVLTRIVGAHPVSILTHNLIGTAWKT